ncbi:MAG: hypothetical protein BWX54_01608 [Verrucomicrobia bacterium ADurb.Bin018]|nr:MAG: hypothetical protein BWX54_01608 [Verrucomicrobia bacterium ADurb.Bin018]
MFVISIARAGSARPRCAGSPAAKVIGVGPGGAVAPLFHGGLSVRVILEVFAGPVGMIDGYGPMRGIPLIHGGVSLGIRRGCQVEWIGVVGIGIDAISPATAGVGDRQHRAEMPGAGVDRGAPHRVHPGLQHAVSAKVNAPDGLSGGVGFLLRVRPARHEQIFVGGAIGLHDRSAQVVGGVVFEPRHQLTAGKKPLFVNLSGIEPVGVVGIKDGAGGSGDMGIVRRFQQHAAVLVVRGGIIVVQGGLAGAVLRLAQAHGQHLLPIVPVPVIDILHAAAVPGRHARDDSFGADHRQGIGVGADHQRVVRIRDQLPRSAALVSHREFVFIEAFAQFQVGFPDAATVGLHGGLGARPIIPCAGDQHFGGLLIRIAEANPARGNGTFQVAIFQLQILVGVGSCHADQISVFPVGIPIPVGIGIPKAFHPERFVGHTAALGNVVFGSIQMIEIEVGRAVRPNPGVSARQIGHEQVIRCFFMIVVDPAIGGDDLQSLTPIELTIVQNGPLMAMPPVSRPSENEV